MKIYLEILNGHREGVSALIDKDAFSIGNHEGCDIFIGAGDVPSRVGIRRERRDAGEGDDQAGALVIDSVSGNECFVNGHPVGAGTIVGDGDILTVNRTRVYAGINRDRAEAVTVWREARGRMV